MWQVWEGGSERGSTMGIHRRKAARHSHHQNCFSVIVMPHSRPRVARQLLSLSVWLVYLTSDTWLRVPSSASTSSLSAVTLDVGLLHNVCNYRLFVTDPTAPLMRHSLDLHASYLANVHHLMAVVSCSNCYHSMLYRAKFDTPGLRHWDCKLHF